MEDQADRGVIAVARRAPHPLAYAHAPPTHVAGDPEDHDLAVASVVCGLIFFVPLIPGAMSVTFGIGVIRRATRLRRRDLALAVAGTTLGAINLLLSAVLLAAAFAN